MPANGCACVSLIAAELNAVGADEIVVSEDVLNWPSSDEGIEDGMTFLNVGTHGDGLAGNSCCRRKLHSCCQQESESNGTSCAPIYAVEGPKHASGLKVVFVRLVGGRLHIGARKHVS